MLRSAVGQEATRILTKRSRANSKGSSEYSYSLGPLPGRDSGVPVLYTLTWYYNELLHFEPVKGR